MRFQKEEPNEGTMLSHCANPRCSKPFLRLGEGKLFLVESEIEVQSGASPGTSYNMRRPPARRVERYWLCNPCAQSWTLVQDPATGIGLVPLPRPPANQAQAGEVQRQSEMG